jgi:hypothetical protein
MFCAASHLQLIARLLTLGVLLIGCSPRELRPARNSAAFAIEVHVSRTAHLFHIVDQLSAWSPFCHSQYRRHFEPLSDLDLALLEEHAALRGKHGWGGALEQAFYTTGDLESALLRLAPGEAAVERDVLRHFAPRIDALVDQERATLEAFRQRLAAEGDRLAEFARQVGRFFSCDRVAVPVFLIANPAARDCGGGYNGGRLTLEIPHEIDVHPMFLHEIFHAFIETRRPLLERACAEGLDYETLSEGLAYALSPGLIHPGGGDPLAGQVAADAAAKKTLRDAYCRFNRLGLALRPLLREALDDRAQTIETFLPRAGDAWRILREIDAGSTYRRGSLKTAFIFGEDTGPVFELLSRKQDRHVFARGHTLRDYDEMFENHTKPGDMAVLLVTREGAPIPAKYQDLLPRSWEDIERALADGRILELSGKARQVEVVLLAAPTNEQLRRLIEGTRLIK